MLVCLRGQEGAKGAADLGRHGQWLIRSPALRRLRGPAGSLRSNPTPSTPPDDGSWVGHSLYAISPEVSGKPIAAALPAPAPRCTRRSRSRSESPPQSSPCELALIGDAPFRDPPSALVASWLATSLCLCCVRRAYSRRGKTCEAQIRWTYSRVYSRFSRTACRIFRSVRISGRPVRGRFSTVPRL